MGGWIQKSSKVLGLATGRNRTLTSTQSCACNGLPPQSLLIENICIGTAMELESFAYPYQTSWCLTTFRRGGIRSVKKQANNKQTTHRERAHKHHAKPHPARSRFMVGQPLVCDYILAHSDIFENRVREMRLNNQKGTNQTFRSPECKTGLPWCYPQG